MAIQYTIINDTDKILYLNSMEIALHQGDKRWFYFDTFDIRYVLSSVGFLTISHKYNKLYVEGEGQLEYKIDPDGKTIHVIRNRGD